jgi:hypothetical protein
MINDLLKSPWHFLSIILAIINFIYAFWSPEQAIMIAAGMAIFLYAIWPLLFLKSGIYNNVKHFTGLMAAPFGISFVLSLVVWAARLTT